MNETLQEALIQTAVDAGHVIMQIYQQPDLGISQKQDDSPLTQADLASHLLICARLQQLDPATPVLSEESAAVPWSERRHWQRFWCVDPLDGTKEFIKRNGEFTVNIALVEAGIPVWGVVHAPALGLSWCGGSDGAWMQETDGPRREIRVRRPLPHEALHVVASRSHGSEAVEQLLARLGPHRTRSYGSSIKLCAVASGEAHLYPRLGPTSCWDTAAAHAVVTAAGGRVCDCQLQELNYQREEILNPWFLVGHASVLGDLPTVEATI